MVICDQIAFDETWWICDTVESGYIIHLRTRPKWLIKAVGSNSSSKCQLYCENIQIRWSWVALLHCVDLCQVSRAWACPEDHNFFLPYLFRWSHLARMKHNRFCWPTWGEVRESVSQAATPAMRAICAALSAPMFPLAPLKVADVTGGLDDASNGIL